MQIPVQISFHQLPPSSALANTVRRKAAQLEQFYPRITSMRVLIESSTRRHRQGNLFHVRIEIKIPGHDLVVNRDPAEHHAHEDPYVAVRDAFRAARRKLEDQVRIHFRGKTRHREEPAHAIVTRLFPHDDCGFLTSQDGREVYFHRHSLVDGDFVSLAVGDEVRYTETRGEKGPQASSVRVVGRTGTHRMPFFPITTPLPGPF